MSSLAAEHLLCHELWLLSLQVSWQVGLEFATCLGCLKASFRAGELGLGGGWMTPEYRIQLWPSHLPCYAHWWVDRKLEWQCIRSWKLCFWEAECFQQCLHCLFNIYSTLGVEWGIQFHWHAGRGQGSLMSLFIDVQWRAIKLNIGLYFKTFFFFFPKLEVVRLNAFHE